MSKDIFDHKGFRSRFVLYSAYHKNLRLTTTSRALEWLDILLLISKPENIRKYLLKICLEETRSIRLLQMLRQPQFDIYELTAEFMSIKKKWHHKGLQADLINNWYESYLLTLNQIKHGHRPINVNQDELKSNYLYNHYFYYKMTKTDDSEFWFAAANNPNEELKEFLSCRPENSYSRMFCSDLICGIGPLEEKCKVETRRRADTLRVPYFEEWVQDIHTSSGIRMIRENRNLIIENKHVFPNLVLSGQVLAVLWRMRTVNRFGDIVDDGGRVRRWADTTLDQNEIKAAAALDSYYYPKVF